MRRSKNLILPLLSLLLLFQIPSYAQWTPDAMMQISLLKRVEPSPNGNKVVYTVQQHKKINNAWRDDTQIFLTDRVTKQSVQLTHEPGKTFYPVWSPDGKYVAFITNIGEGSQLKVISAAGGNAWTLVQAKAPIKKLAWSPDGKMISYTKDDFIPKPILPQPIVFTFFNLKRNNLWLVHLDQQKKRIGNPEQITHYDDKSSVGMIGSLNWSPDNTRVAFIRYSPKTDAFWATGTLMVINLKDHRNYQVIKAKMLEHCPHFSPDGKRIAFLSGSHVYIIPSEGGKPKHLGLTPDQLPLSLIGWSADGKTIYAKEFYHTYYSLLALPSDGKQVKMINPKNKLINNISLNANGTEFGFNMQDTNHPEEAYISQLNPFKPIQVSHINKNIPTYPMGVTKVIHWRSKDGWTIEGLLTYPIGYEKGKRYPLLVENHGGPGFVFQDYCTARQSVYPVSIFATQGYLYFRPNIRGSSGYGPKFRNSIYKDWGGADFQDVLSGVQHLVDIGIADPNRMGILGWSFGGYMGTWAVTQTHQFKAASVGGAITDLISYAGTGDLPHFLSDALGGYFWDDPSLYLNRSPIMFVKNVKTPTLLLNGQLDYRVPHTQSEEFYRALKQQGIPTKLVLYPNTYHSIKKAYLIVDAAKRTIAWMDKYVKNPENNNGNPK